jgi:cation:H+ antiporter
MTALVALPAFLAGTLVSLVTSIVLVARLERVGERLRLSEALLGIVAALAADAPEVTAAVTAMAHHEQRVGAGVILGSNVFNLAALLGLGAMVAGRIALHRKVVLLGGAVALWVAVVCVPVVLGFLPAVAGLILALVVVTGYGLVLGTEGRGLERLAVPRRWSAWVRSAVSEEELELEDAIRPARGRWPDAAVAAAALIVVVAASVTMERAASALGARYAVPEIVVGGLMLAAVTSLPNAVAAVYLAARGRAAATLSTALNSNTLNVVAGLLLPAAVIGLGRPSGQAVLVTVWYIALTLAVLALAWRDHGLGRGTGSLVITAYVAFTLSVLASGYAIRSGARVVLVVAVLSAAALVGQQLLRRREDGMDAAGTPPASPPVRVRAFEPARDPGDRSVAARNGHRPRGSSLHAARWPARALRRESLLSGWTVGRLWVASLCLSALVATVDAALGPRVVLIGLLIVGPCGALLTGRWVPTGLAGLWATGLAMALGLPDGIWGTATHLAFLIVVGTIALTTTVAAAAISNARS